MTFKIFRRGSARIGIISAFIIFLICLYYISIGSSQNSKDVQIKRYVLQLPGLLINRMSSEALIFNHFMRCHLGQA